MKTVFTFLFVLFGTDLLFSQVNVDLVATPPTPMSTNTITYQPEIPASNTYKIIKNTTGSELSNKILEEINLNRRYDEDFLWVVNDNVEILIYYFNKPNTIEPTVD